MAEPNSTTEKAVDALPGGTSSSEVGLASREPNADASAPIHIEPNAVVETSGEAASERAAVTAPAVAAPDRASKPAPRASARPAARSSSKISETDLDAKPLAAYELLARSARLGDLVALTNRIVSDAARTRSFDWSFGPKVLAAADEAKLSHEDADTKFGNVLDVLSTGGEGAAERALACALWAHAVAESPRSRSEDEDRLAGDILWLATHTSFDATPLVDRALGEDAGDLWEAIADRVRRIDRERGGALGRGEALFGCAALSASPSEKAKQLSRQLTSQLRDPMLLRVLDAKGSAATGNLRVEGELTAAPRGFVATALLACTGILFAAHAVRLFARAALAYRRPAEVSLSDSGVTVKSRTVMLGRTLQEREHVIPRSGLVRVVREVRFPRLSFYAGLLALAIGSYVGVRTFVDGVRAASPSLLLVGLLVIGCGIAVDFVLGSILPGTRGRCRLAFVPRSGPTVCVGDIDIREADDAIARALSR